MTDILAAAGGLALRVLIGMGAMAALLIPAMMIVLARLAWTHLREHRHAHHRHAH